MLSHDYNWDKKKKREKKQDGLKLKILARGWQYNREAGLSVCFDLPFIGSAGGSPRSGFIHSITRLLSDQLTMTQC